MLEKCWKNVSSVHRALGIAWTLIQQTARFIRACGNSNACIHNSYAISRLAVHVWTETFTFTRVICAYVVSARYYTSHHKHYYIY